jgi:hypothetical protein
MSSRAIAKRKRKGKGKAKVGEATDGTTESNAGTKEEHNGMADSL